VGDHLDRARPQRAGVSAVTITENQSITRRAHQHPDGELRS
jgi:hypothetical protein